MSDTLMRPEKMDLEHLKLSQERELKEREFALKERELELQHRQSWLARWSTPAVVAIVAGIIGYAGTLLSSFQNRKLEREKQEATLILEAIKTAGTAEERERQTAANLVFLADAGLITAIKPTELDKLRSKAQGAGPSLPAPQAFEFKRSSALTAELQSKLQTALLDYQQFFARIGYDVTKSRDRVVVRIDEDSRDNAYFDNESVAVSGNLARDSEYVLAEYTWFMLKQANPAAFQLMWDSNWRHAQGFFQGLKFYFLCSYSNDPHVGKNYYALTGAQSTTKSSKYLFNLQQQRAFQKSGGEDESEPHRLGEVWGAALWEIRSKLGAEKTDRLVLDAWKRFGGEPAALRAPRYYVDTIVKSLPAGGGAGEEKIVRDAFVRRNLS